METKTLTTREIINAYNVLNKLNIQKLENEEVLALLRFKKKVRPIVKAYDEFVEDARKSVIPENINEISHKMQAQRQLTSQESAMLIEADKRLTELLSVEVVKTHEIEMSPELNETTLVKLFKECGLETKDEDHIYFLFE